MDQTRYYPGTFDVSQLAAQLTTQLQMRGYQAQWFGAAPQVVVQVRKGSEAAKVFGVQAALSLMFHQHPQGLLVTLGQQAWGDKAVAAGVGALILWPLAISAAVGAVRQSNLPAEVLTLLDVLVAQQQPGAAPAAVPAYLMPQVQQMYQRCVSLRRQAQRASSPCRVAGRCRSLRRRPSLGAAIPMAPRPLKWI